MQNRTRSRSKRQRRTVVAIFTILAAALLVLSVLIIPRAVSTYAVSNSGPNPHYVPSSAFGDSDDLPAGTLKPAARGLAAGNSSVSGTVIDASSGQPVANALVGISAERHSEGAAGERPARRQCPGGYQHWCGGVYRPVRHYGKRWQLQLQRHRQWNLQPGGEPLQYQRDAALLQGRTADAGQCEWKRHR